MAELVVALSSRLDLPPAAIPPISVGALATTLATCSRLASLQQPSPCESASSVSTFLLVEHIRSNLAA